MSHLAFQPPGPAVVLDVDYVVVGSGAGGATAAATLARTGARVCLVEAGAWRDPGEYPYSAYAGMRDLMPDFGAAVTAGRASWPIVQGRAVGGSTVINSAIAVRTPGDLFDQWQSQLGFGGDAMRQRVWATQEAIEGELCATETPVSAMGNSNRLAIEGATALGFENHATTRFVKNCEGTGQCLQGCNRSRKQSLNLNYVPEVIRRGGTVLSCAPVDRVLLERGRAIGVCGRFKHPRTRGRGASFTVRASRGVMVAASVMHTATMLRRSGLRHRALGHGFRSHPGTGIFGWYDNPVDMNKGATQGWASVAYREQPGFKLETLAIPPELVASRIKGGGQELMARLKEYRHLAMWVMAVRGDTVGSLWRGPFGTVARYSMTPHDMEVMRGAAVLIAKMHFAAGASWVIPGVHGIPWRLYPDDLHLLENCSTDPRAWVAVLSHLFGGATMGTDPSRSVCDPRGQVHGVAGLAIADASCIPTTLGVNPQLTIMALARMHAEDFATQSGPSAAG